MGIVRIPLEKWAFFMEDDEKLYFESDMTGKWMYYFEMTAENIALAEEVCSAALGERVAFGAKYSRLPLRNDLGVMCLYVNRNDTERHKAVLDFLIKKGLVERTEEGGFRDIVYKFEKSSHIGETAEDFVPTMRLSDLMDLSTGEWL